ncbi:MAG TPA: hypothetical protein VMU95_17070 [Trebonia sp.]|nr:hypothetical protein [Trebonia sp.]
MAETSNARRGYRRRLAVLLAPLVLAGSIALGGVAEASCPPPPPKCVSVYGWSSVLFKTGGTVFYSTPRCHELSIEFVGKPGWYQGYSKSWATHWKWVPCGKPMFLWKKYGFAILCKWVPKGSFLRVANLQGKFVPIKVNV